MKARTKASVSIVRTLSSMAVAVMASASLWAEGEITPLMLVNFKFEQTPEVPGWINHYQSGGGTLPGSGAIETNGVRFVTTSAGNFYERAKVTTDFEAGEYVDVFGAHHETLVEEIKASLELPDLELTDDVYKTGLMNGGQAGNIATIGGLETGTKYLVYLGYGLYKADGSWQQCGFQLENSGFTSLKALEYVCTSNGVNTVRTTAYTPFPVGQQVKPGSQGLMVVRLTNVIPTAAGEIKFRMYGDRSGINWLAVAKVTAMPTTATVGGAVNWSGISWSETVDAESLLELTLTGDTTLTVDAVPAFASLKIKKAASAEGPVTLKIVAQEALPTNLAIEDGVVYTDIEINAAAGAAIKAAALTVPADKTLTIVGTDDAEAPLELSGLLTVNGALKTKGFVRVTNGQNNAAGCVVETGATMEIVDGTTAMKFADRGMRGTLTIDADATLQPIDYVDACKYDGASTVNVYGTLDMTDAWARWTLRANNVMNFYAGSHVFGNGQSGTNTGAIQFNTTGCILHFKTVEELDTNLVDFDPLLHAQQPFTLDVDEGVVVTMASGMGTDKQPMTLTGAGRVIVESDYAFNAPVTVSEGATLELTATGTLANGASGEGSVVFASTTPVLGTVFRAPLALTVPEATTEIALQATDAEITAGELTLQFSNLALPEELVWTVTRTGGQPVGATAVDLSGGLVRVELGVTRFTESTATVDWAADLSGRVIVQGVTEEGQPEVVLTFNKELPAGVEEIYFVGKVIVAAEGMTLPSGKFRFAPGSDITLSADLRAETTTVTAGATLRVRDVTLTKAIEIAAGATVVVEGEVSAVKIATQAANATLTIAEGATLTVTQNQALGVHARSQGTYNIYGTLNLGAYNWNHNFNNCTINGYAGGKIVGTTGLFVCGGGAGATYNLRNNDRSEERAFTFDVIMNEDFGDYPDTYVCENNVGLKILKNNNRANACVVSGTCIRGLEIAYGTFKVAANDRCLRDLVKVGPNARLVLDSRHDLINYGGGVAYPTTLDIAGTLQIDRRQTIFAENTITLRDGARMTGSGELHQSVTKALHVCRNATIVVDGVAEISAPNFVNADQTLTFVKGTDAEKGLAIVEQSFVNSGVLKVADNAAVIFASGAQDKLAEVPEDAEGLVVALNDGIGYTKANGVLTLTIPADAGTTVQLGTATLRGSMPAGLATSNAKFALWIRDGKLLATKSGFTFILR